MQGGARPGPVRPTGVAILPTRPDGARVTGGRTTGGAGARTGYVRFLQIGDGLPKMEPCSIGNQDYEHRGTCRT